MAYEFIAQTWIKFYLGLCMKLPLAVVELGCEFEAKSSFLLCMNICGELMFPTMSLGTLNKSVMV